jgi:hypothetical protein
LPPGIQLRPLAKPMEKPVAGPAAAPAPRPLDSKRVIEPRRHGGKQRGHKQRGSAH